MSASAGGTSIPGPVTLSVDDADVVQMWRAVQRQRHGVSQPWMFWLGFGLVLTNGFILSIMYGAGVREHAQPYSFALNLLIGVAFIVMAFRRDTDSGGTLRPTELRFDAAGLSVEVAFAPPSPRRYVWRNIERIDDIGDAFMLVPKFERRIVLPKRAFADRGAEAWAFFCAHGVAGRIFAPPHAGAATLSRTAGGR